MYVELEVGTELEIFFLEWSKSPNILIGGHCMNFLFQNCILILRRVHRITCRLGEPRPSHTYTCDSTTKKRRKRYHIYRSLKLRVKSIRLPTKSHKSNNRSTSVSTTKISTSTDPTYVYWFLKIILHVTVYFKCIITNGFCEGHKINYMATCHISNI